jgi:hypothetical protein
MGRDTHRYTLAQLARKGRSSSIAGQHHVWIYTDGKRAIPPPQLYFIVNINISILFLLSSIFYTVNYRCAIKQHGNGGIVDSFADDCFQLDT